MNQKQLPASSDSTPGNRAWVARMDDLTPEQLQRRVIASGRKRSGE